MTIPSRARRRRALAAGVLAALLPAAARAGESLDVRIEGIGGALKKNVLASLDIEEKRKDKDLDEARIRRLHGQAREQIEAGLQPFGYYRPVIQSALDHEKGRWIATYKVDAGPPLQIGTVDFRIEGPGAADPGFERLRATFPLRPGETLLQPAYEGAKQVLEGYAAAHGYLDAAYAVSQIRIDLARYTSDVVVHFTTGPRYRFGPVRFHQDFLAPDLLKGYVDFKTGDPLDANKLLKFQNALSAAAYFQRVEVIPRRDLAQGTELPIDVNLTAAKRFRYTAGVGYGTDTGPRVTGGVEVRRVNSLGHRADVQARLSEIEKSFQSDYVVPGAFPRTDLLTYTLGYADLHPQTSQSRSFIVGATDARALGRWRESFGLDFTRATFTVGSDAGTSKLLTPTASWTRVFADDRIYPTHGEKIELDLSAADRSLLSNATFASGHLAGKFIRSFGHQRFRLLTRAELGYLSTGDFHLLPPAQRFFAGGDQSVRGYSYQGIGLRDAQGHVIGGTELATGSVELEFRVLQKWGIAVFYDTGSASDRLAQDLKVGTGAGIRWLSPIGMVRLDAAIAVREPNRPVRLHFTIGPDL